MWKWLRLLVCSGMFCVTHTFAGSGSIDPATGDADISVHFTYPPTTQEIQNVRDTLQMLAEGVCDASDGQIVLDKIRLTGARADADRAEFWIHALPGRSGGNIFSSGSLGRLGSHLNMFTGAALLPDVWLHEWGHQAYGLGEQYSEQRRFGSSCGLGRGFDTVDERNNSIMQQSGRAQCVGGTSNGSRCIRDGDCISGTCDFVHMSEMSTDANHDLLQGTGTCPTGSPLSEIVLSGILSTSDTVQIFDGTSFATADASSSWSRSVEAIDAIGNLPAAKIKLYLTRTDVNEWELNATIDEGLVSGTVGKLILLETWTLTFNPDGSLNSLSESSPDFVITGLTTGAADLNVSLDLGTANPTAAPGQGTDGLVQGVGITNIAESHDGAPQCNDTFYQCASNFNSTTMRFESTMQTLWNGRSDWAHVAANFPFISPPTGLPTAAPSTECAAAVNFVEDISGSDQVLLILDRSGSMGQSSSTSNAEVCLNGIDDDRDGTTDEADCSNPRIDFARAGARAFVNLQSGRGIEVGLLEFDGMNRLVLPIDLLDGSNLDTYRTEIDALTPRGQTAIGDAFNAAETEFMRVAGADRSQTAYLLTDGFNTTGGDPVVAAERLKDMDVRIHAIGAGGNVNTDQLLDIAERTAGQMFQAKEVNELPSLFAELAAHQQGAALALQRVNFAIAQDPGQAIEQNPDHRKEEEITEARSFEIEVERGARGLTVFLAGRNQRMQEWGIDIVLTSPDGQVFDQASPEITVDSHYLFLNLPKPESGTWVLNVKPDAPGLQLVTALAFIENPHPKFFIDVRPGVVRAGENVEVSATMSYLVDLDPAGISVAGRLTLPDGTQQSVTLAAEPIGGAFTAELAGLSQNGIHELTLEGRTLPDAQVMRGEPIFEGPERAPVKVEHFRRFASTRFLVVDGEPLPCRNNDCDQDGIPDGNECVKPSDDVDEDGLPSMRDEDSDNDEIPDAVEGGQDWNEDGIDDACQEGPVRPSVPVGSIEELIKRQKAIIEVACSAELDSAVSSEIESMVDILARLISASGADEEKLSSVKELFAEVADRLREFASIAEQGAAECRIAEELLVPVIELEAEIINRLQR